MPPPETQGFFFQQVSAGLALGCEQSPCRLACRDAATPDGRLLPPCEVFVAEQERAEPGTPGVVWLWMWMWLWLWMWDHNLLPPFTSCSGSCWCRLDG